MIISGNIVTLYPDETLLQPTPPNAYIVYTFNSLQNNYSEGLFFSRESYRKIKQLFHEGHIEIKIEVRAYDE